MIAGQPAGRGPAGPAAGSRSRGVRAHRRDTGAPEESYRAHPRQPARLRPGIAQCSGLAAGEAMLGGLSACCSRQRADRHRHRPDVRRRPVVLARPGLVNPGTRRCTPGSGRSSSTTGSRRCLAVPTVYGTLAQVPRSTPTSTRCASRSPARPRCPHRYAKPSPPTPGAGCWKATGSPRPPAPAPGPDPVRNAPARPAAALPGQQVKAVRIGDDGSWSDCAPGQTACWRSAAPPCSPAYVTDPRAVRPPAEHRRPRPGRLAGHRGPRPRRRRRLRVPHRPGQGPDHPRRPQHRPEGDRRRAAGPSRRRRGRRPSAAPTGTPARSRWPTSSPPPRPARARPNCWPGPPPPSTSPPPGRNTSTRSTRSRSPRWASRSSPRWPPTPPPAPLPRRWPRRACRTPAPRRRTRTGGWSSR